MHIASWRALPLFLVIAIAAVLFWALVSVFGSESTSDDRGSSIVAAGVDDGLERIPLEFPEVAKPLIEALPSPEPSPSPSPATAAAPARKRSTATTTRTRNVPIPSDGTTGNAVTGASGDPMIGPDDRSDSVGSDDDDIVGDINDELDNVGPDDDADETPDPEPEPEPSQDDDGGLDVDNTSSGTSGNNGANGSSETATDDGEANEGEVD